MSEVNMHIPVMLDEVLSFYNPKMSNIIDLTLGRGGHSLRLLEKCPSNTKYVGVDCDIDALSYSQKIIQKSINNNKVDMKFFLSKYSKAFDNISSFMNGADFILMDIGVSSPQFDDPSRGFSYRFDSTLDMRMDKTQNLNAKDVINSYSKEELVRVFRDLGGVKVYNPVIKSILDKRKIKEITTTSELVEIIKSSLPKSVLKKEGHPAKQFFLGIRYEVNDELNELKNGLDKAIKFLNEDGVLVIICFNYSEDKIAKNIINKWAKKKKVDKYAKGNDNLSSYINLTEKPLLPKEEEIEKNRRSKSAILRAIKTRSL